MAVWPSLSSFLPLSLSPSLLSSWLPLHLLSAGLLEQDGRLCLFDISVAIFFLSYILIVMIVIVNIVLAV